VCAPYRPPRHHPFRLARPPQHAELSRQRQDASAEKAQLETELTMVRNELSACSARLAKTHEALGISAEKASMLERSQGRLQIDLHGTLTTLEEASRRHKAERQEHMSEAAQREADLTAQLEASRREAAALRQKLEAANGHGAQLRHQLAKAQVDADTTHLHMKHQIERLAERIEAAEGRRLDPTVLANVKFAKTLLIAPPKGRLQQTVPPTAWASPAPL
jgi:chromosome segregation ATPase